MAADQAKEEQRLRDEVNGPLVQKSGLAKKKVVPEDGDGVVKKPVLGKSKFRRR